MTEPVETPSTPPAATVAAPAPSAPAPAAEATAKTAPPSPAVLVLGFIILLLLGGMLAMNLRPKATESGTGETSAAVAERIKKDIDLLISRSTNVQGELSGKDAQLVDKTKALLDKERTNQALASQFATVQEEVVRLRSEAVNVEVYKKQLADARTQVEAFSTQLATLKGQLAEHANRPDSGDYNALQRQLEEALRAKAFYEGQAKQAGDPSELQSLREELARLRQRLGSSLFAAREEDMYPLSKELFRGLQKLQRGSDLETRAAYAGFETLLGAKVVKTVKFPTGSSTPSTEDESALRDLARTQKSGDGGFLLVVGYASETGNVDANRALSSSRATAVAETLDAVKLPGQKVQAVYLGQTSRFDAQIPENNQLCEIWHIRTKN